MNHLLIVLFSIDVLVVFADSMLVAISFTAPIESAMLPIESSLTHTSSVDALSVFIASVVAGFQITSRSLPSGVTDTRGSQTLAMGATVKAANS